MLDFLFKHRLILMIIDFVIMLAAAFGLLILHLNGFGYVLVATVMIGLVFATIDTELRDLEAEAEEAEKTIDQL